MQVFQALEDLKAMARPCPAVAEASLDPWRRRWSAFASDNGLVDDPLREAQEDRSGLDWSPAEREVFMARFLAHPKDFAAIAEGLRNRSEADCVVFFYKNQKSGEFAALRRRQMLRKQMSQRQAQAQLALQAGEGGAGGAGAGAGAGGGAGPSSAVAAAAAGGGGAARRGSGSLGMGAGRAVSRGAGAGASRGARGGGDYGGDDGEGGGNAGAPPTAPRAASGVWPDDDTMRRAVSACGRDWARLAAFVGGDRSASNLQWYYARSRKRLGLDALADEAERGGGGGGGSAGKRARGGE